MLYNKKGRKVKSKFDFIMKKIKSAVTDSEASVTFKEGKDGVNNLITIYSCCTGKSIEEIENEKDKKNKLEMLIDDTCEQLISHARNCVSGYSKIKLNKSIDNKSLEDDLSKYMISFKKNNLSRYKDSLSYNIINIFDYILTKCLCKIAWIDDGKYITMVSSIDRLRGTNLVITSGVKSSTKILLDIDRIVEIHREGSIFTVLIDGVLKDGVNYYENETECIEESN